MNEYNFKTGLQKTVKNVALVVTPAVAVEVLNNIVPLIPSQYVPTAQIVLAALVYLIKNASENGAWK